MQIGKNVVGVQGDVSNLADLDRLYDTVKQQKGRIDILFANAGIFEFAPNKMALITLSSVFIVGVLAIFISLFSYNATASLSTSIVGVQVGGGTLTNPLFGYIPQNVEIKVGTSVVWYVRQAQAEPHTVTFVFDNKYDDKWFSGQ